MCFMEDYDYDDGTKYKQCVLVKEDGDKKIMQTTWIPFNLALPGKTLQLKEGNSWTGGWCVKSVSEVSVLERDIPTKLWNMNEPLLWRPC